MNAVINGFFSMFIACLIELLFQQYGSELIAISSLEYRKVNKCKLHLRYYLKICII